MTCNELPNKYIRLTYVIKILKMTDTDKNTIPMVNTNSVSLKT